jgi:hypothetical protein
MWRPAHARVGPARLQLGRRPAPPGQPLDRTAFTGPREADSPSSRFDPRDPRFSHRYVLPNGLTSPNSAPRATPVRPRLEDEPSQTDHRLSRHTSSDKNSPKPIEHAPFLLLAGCPNPISRYLADAKNKFATCARSGTRERARAIVAGLKVDAIKPPGLERAAALGPSCRRRGRRTERSVGLKRDRGALDPDSVRKLALDGHPGVLILRTRPIRAQPLRTVLRTPISSGDVNSSLSTLSFQRGRSRTSPTNANTSST